MTLEDLHRTVVEGFGRIEDRLAQNDARWAQNDARWAQNEAVLREMTETMRRHFKALVEQIEGSVKIIAEGHTHLVTVTDNHEARLQTLEKRS
jgi:hypothetical protein